MAPVAGELIVGDEAVPAGDLDAATLVILEDAVPNDEQPNAQEMNTVPGEPFDFTIVNHDCVFL